MTNHIFILVKARKIADCVRLSEAEWEEFALQVCVVQNLLLKLLPCQIILSLINNKMH